MSGPDGDLMIGGASANVARHIARERQKVELRRERDRLVLELARDRGGLAEQLGVSPAVSDKLLADARERLGAHPSATMQQIAARRLRTDPSRWAEVDAYYEALGHGLDRDDASPPTATR